MAQGIDFSLPLFRPSQVDMSQGKSSLGSFVKGFASAKSIPRAPKELPKIGSGEPLEPGKQGPISQNEIAPGDSFSWTMPGSAQQGEKLTETIPRTSYWERVGMGFMQADGYAQGQQEVGAMRANPMRMLEMKLQQQKLQAGQLDIMGKLQSIDNGIAAKRFSMEYGQFINGAIQQGNVLTPEFESRRLQYLSQNPAMANSPYIESLNKQLETSRKFLQDLEKQKAAAAQKESAAAQGLEVSSVTVGDSGNVQTTFTNPNVKSGSRPQTLQLIEALKEAEAKGDQVSIKAIKERLNIGGITPVQRSILNAKIRSWMDLPGMEFTPDKLDTLIQAELDKFNAENTVGEGGDVFDYDPSTGSLVPAR